MSQQRVKLAISTFLAVSLALLLAGTSFFFPPQELTPQANMPHPMYVGEVINFPRIIIKTDGTIDPQTAPISQAGNVYTLTKDLTNYTIEIQRSNIIIDGNNHKLQGENGAEGIILANRTNVTIKNIELSQFSYEININTSSNIIIIGNIFSGIGSRGVTLESTTNSTITENTFINAHIELINSSNNTIKENRITTSPYGVSVNLGAFNQIMENTFESVYYPITLKGNTSTVTGNNMQNGIDAISLVEGENNNVFNNVIKEFSESGIILYRASNNIFHENTITNANQSVRIGLVAQQNNNAVENNTFSKNNFLSNTCNVLISTLRGQNVWSENNQGNYWSDYTGADSNKDGIGDTPYVIDNDNVDSYPLMAAYGITLVEENPAPWIIGAGIGMLAIALTTWTALRIKRKVDSSLQVDFTKIA